MAGDERSGLRAQAARRFGFRHDVVVALGQRHVLCGQEFR